MKNLFTACNSCIVKDWCKLRSGEVKLPSDYDFTDFCVGNDKLERALFLANVPKEYKNANLYHYISDGDNEFYTNYIKEILKNAVGFVESGSNILFIHPNKGTGKTWTAIAILNQFIYAVCRNPEWFDYENPVGLYVKFGEWANRVRNIYSINDEEYASRIYKEIEQMKNVPLLVLDDIGSGRITPIIKDLTYDIVDRRKEEQKSTIFTSNYSDTVLKQEDYLGEMIVSRMFYKSAVIELGGNDRRKVTKVISN